MYNSAPVTALVAGAYYPLARIRKIHTDTKETDVTTIVLPHDTDTEQALLGAILLNPTILTDIINVLPADGFYTPQHQLIYGRLLDMFGAGENIDPITLAGKLGGDLDRVGGAPYLHTLIETVPTTAHAQEYARLLADLATRRRLITAAQRIQQHAHMGDDTTDTLVATAQAEMEAVTPNTGGDDVVVLEDAIQDTIDELDALALGGANRGVPTGFHDLDYLTNGLHGGQMIIVAARPGVGKALALDTPLPTPEGWTTMGDVKTGDYLIGPDGHPTRVTNTTNIMHNRTCYEVEFSDGTTIIADAEHQWVTHDRKERRYHRDPSIRTTQQIKDTLRTNTKDQRLNHSIRNTRPIQGEEKTYLVAPYTLGVWLGDGTSEAAHFTTPDHEVVKNVRDDGYISEPSNSARDRYSMQLPKPAPNGRSECVWCSGKTSTPEIAACQPCHDKYSTIQGRLRHIGVLGNKHIPQDYLRGSESQRRALLAGLMDTDGTVTVGGAYQFAVTSKPLADGMRELLASLGYRYGVSTKRVKGASPESSVCYTITFSTPHDVFRVSRKQAAHDERYKARNAARSNSRYITAVREIESVPVRCVQVDNGSSMYLAGENMVPTHNSTLGLDFMRSCSIRFGKPSVIFSLEMSKTEITQRLLAAEADVKIGDMRGGRLTDEHWAKISDAVAKVTDAPLYIDDSPSLTMLDIRAKARRLHAKQPLGLVVVDYLQLMSSGRKVESRQQEVSEFSRQLKLLAKELDVPVVAISQLNRGPEQRPDKKPQLSDLRESGSLEQDADMVMLLNRPDSQDKDSDRAGEADIILAKHRGGPIDTIAVAHQLHYSRFRSMARG